MKGPVDFARAIAFRAGIALTGATRPAHAVSFVPGIAPARPTTIAGRIARAGPTPAGRIARAGAIVALCMLLAAPLSARADTAEGFSATLTATEASARTIAKGAWNQAAEEGLVDKIDALADSFHALAADGAAVGPSADRLLDLVESTRKRYTAELERIQAKVIEEDGDLEAAQDSAQWRTRELLAMRLLYRANWIHYEIAMRYEHSSAKRKQHLLAAREGFGEFIGSGDRELTRESLFGRGLAAKVLKDYKPAVADFRAVLADSPDPDTAEQVRSALAESLLASGDYAAALTETATLLAGSPSGELASQVRFLRAKALLLALEKKGAVGDAATRKRYRGEAAALLEQLYKLGSYWRGKALQLIDAGIADPQQWAADGGNTFVTWLVADSSRRRGNCPGAVSLYASLVGRGAYLAESHYGLGFCAFHAGDYARALSELSAFLDVAAEGNSYRAQAAYLRFKAAESLYLKSGQGADGEAARSYLKMLEDYLSIAPKHDSAYEAWFRLGEWHRDRGELAQCADAFAKVEGDPSFRLKARFLEAECLSQQVENLPEGTEIPAELVRKALAAVDAFLAQAADFRAAKSTKAGASQLLAPMEANATLMGAALVAKASVGTMADRLARLQGFEDRFPGEKRLLPELFSLRIVAYRTLGDLDSAGSELERLLALPDTGSYGDAALKKLGIVFLNEAAARDKDKDSAGAERARRVALVIYQRILTDTRASGSSESTAGVESLIADLQRELKQP